jgi:hypothetical protein
MSQAQCTCRESIKGSFFAPCSLHQTTPAMVQAFRALRGLNATQRARVLCWFCSTCNEHIPPGDEHKCPMVSDIDVLKRRVRILELTLKLERAGRAIDEDCGNALQEAITIEREASAELASMNVKEDEVP